MTEIITHLDSGATVLVLASDATEDGVTPIPVNEVAPTSDDIGTAMQTGGFGGTNGSNEAGLWFATVYLSEIGATEIVVDGRERVETAAQPAQSQAPLASQFAQAGELRGLVGPAVQMKASSKPKKKKGKATEKWTYSSGEIKETYTKGQRVTLPVSSPVFAKGGGMKKSIVKKAVAHGVVLAATFGVGATGVGQALFWPKIIAFAEKVSEPSRWLKENHPKLYQPLRQSDHDLLFFLIKDDFDEIRETVLAALRESQTR